MNRRPDAPRDLLFGLIALQNGLIIQDQLLAAFRAWTLDKGRALADHLVAQGNFDADHRAAVEALVALYLKKHGGSAEQSLAAIAVGPSTRDSLARLDLPDLEGTLAHINSAPVPNQTERDPDHTATYSVGSVTSDGQRFHVLRPHARGGLGAVFVALDSELHREVALKQILDRHADDPASRARFVMEAEITGGLEHPGIVPVYGLGTYGDGRPYYAMRFIRGDSLKEAIERFHTDAARRKTPGSGRLRSASSCGGFSMSATRSTTPTAVVSCTAISSRPTSSSANTARRWSSTGGWPKPKADPTPSNRPTSGRWYLAPPAAAPKLCRAVPSELQPT